MIGNFTVKFRPQWQSLLRLGTFCSLLFGLQLSSYAQWKPTKYPSKAPWLVCSTPNGNLLAGAYVPPLGVRISTDKGDTYTEIPALSDVAYTSSCQVGQTIFLGGFGGSIARSDDNGQNWRLSNFGTVFPSGVEITDCYGLEFFKGKLFASGFGAGIAYSDDMGETWKNTDVSALVALDEACYVYAMKAYKEVLYAFTVRGIFKYDEAATKWVFIRETLYPSCTAIHKGNLYVGHSAPNGLFFILKTSDGENWEPVAAPAEILTNDARAMASNGDVLYVGSTTNGVFYTLDEGKTWVDFNEDFPNSFQDFYITPLNFAFIGDEVFLSGFHIDYGDVFKRKVATGTALEVVSDTQYQVLFDKNTAALTLSGEYAEAQIAVYSMDGKLVCRQTVAPSGQMLLGRCPKGTYMYRVEIGKDHVFTGKFAI
ncbi:hypothetical protein [Porphyromonas gulae]|uniref:hypothetical protein n=1 Tax=Porphyromonas gulae TaxID=111105 RepID=UPI0026F1FDB4|nr:hypothetical protein [Porphyromonas gulae]